MDRIARSYILDYLRETGDVDMLETEQVFQYELKRCTRAIAKRYPLSFSKAMFDKIQHDQFDDKELQRLRRLLKKAALNVFATYNGDGCYRKMIRAELQSALPTDDIRYAQVCDIPIHFNSLQTRQVYAEVQRLVVPDFPYIDAAVDGFDLCKSE